MALNSSRLEDIHSYLKFAFLAALRLLLSASLTARAKIPDNIARDQAALHGVVNKGAKLA